MSSNNTLGGERRPLLLSSEDSTVNTSPIGEDQRGKATVWETILNLSKTCMGTGTLALPFAARQGGVGLYVVGMVLIAMWNLYAIQRLVHCLELLPSSYKENGITAADGTGVQGPPEGTSTLGKVAWFALGPKGLLALDIMFVLLLCGIIVAYEDAIMAFLQDTSFTTHSRAWDALVTAIIMGALAVVPDMGHLARISALGLVVLLGTFVCIAGYVLAHPSSSNDSDSQSAFTLLPQNGLEGVSHWFGCVVFGFGTVPLTYHMRDAMKNPTFIVWPASTLAMLGVALFYLILGLGLWGLYPTIESDVLSELPPEGWLPTLVRLAMVLVIMVTAPLLIVPCGELVEAKLGIPQPHSALLQTSVRLSICIVCTVIAVWVPAFVYVLSFVGCFCVAGVSFVVPPLLHGVLGASSVVVSKADQLLDLCMFVWGIMATLISSAYTFRQMVSQ